MATDVPTRHRAPSAIRRAHPVGTTQPATVAGQHGLSQFLPALALVGVAVVWGVTFSVVDHAVIDGSVGQLPPADLVAWRFTLGTAILLVIRVINARRRRTVAGRRDRAGRMPAVLRRQAVLLGGFLGAGFLLQTWAMTYTDAMMSAFLTGLLVVIAPVAGWVMFRDRPAAVTWIAVAVATGGLAVLSLRGAGFGPGEMLTLLAAAMWAIHLVLLARWARPGWAIELATIQTATVAAMALVVIAVGSAVDGRSLLPGLPVGASGWLSVGFLAVLATAGAMLLLSWAQTRMSATRAAVILTLEPAIAAVTAACLGSEFGIRTLVGGSLLLVAMYLIELGGRTEWLSQGRRWRPRSRRRPG